MVISCLVIEGGGREGPKGAGRAREAGAVGAGSGGAAGVGEAEAVGAEAGGGVGGAGKKAFSSCYVLNECLRKGDPNDAGTKVLTKNEHKLPNFILRIGQGSLVRRRENSI